MSRPARSRISTHISQTRLSFSHRTFLLSLIPLVCFYSICCSSDPASILEAINVPEYVGQLVLVTSENWETSSGRMRLFERVKDGWQETGTQMDVVIGRNGMGWGCGLQWEKEAGPLKREGDGRSPAGAFEFGTAFGYDSLPPPGTRMLYRTIGPDDYFVDDPESADYNKWIRLQAGVDPNDRWKSYEKMLRPDDLYSLGIIIDHNREPVVKGKGSAIFIHLWKSAQSPTAGCTALSRQDLLRLLKWLDPHKNPLILQIPMQEIGGFRIVR